MKTVQVLLKSNKTVSFPDADVHQDQDGQIAIYDKSHQIICEFRECEIKKWWYMDEGIIMPEIS